MSSSSPKRVNVDAWAVETTLQQLLDAAPSPGEVSRGIMAFLASAGAPRDLLDILQRAAISEDCLAALHEVRTLLSASAACLDVAGDTLGGLFGASDAGPRQRARDIADLKTSIADLTMCFDQSITLARGAAATQAGQRAILGHCLALVARLVAKHTRERITVAAAPDLELRAPQGELLQVLLNLVRNAQDAISSVPSGEVQVTAWIAPSMAFVSVADNGPGFAPGMLDEQRFVTTKGRGLGLGLCICRRLVAGWGGALQIESNPRDGAEVIVGIPRWFGG